MTSPGAGSLVREQRPQLERCWIRYVPRRWPACVAPWTDLSSAGMGGLQGSREDLAPLAPVACDDMLYLPPVDESLEGERSALVESHVSRGTPLLVQLSARQQGPKYPGVLWVRDLLAWVLSRDPAAEPPSGTRAAVWPLLPGGGEEDWLEAAAAALAAAGVTWVLPFALDLAPRQRRRLAESAPENVALGLFHETAPSIRQVASIIVRHGMRPYLPRPLPRPPLLGASNLRLAGCLALAGWLCLLANAPPSRSQAFLRASRFAEELPRDLAALIREGNLAVLPWLEEEPRRLLEAALDCDEPPLISGLVAALGSPASQERTLP